MAFMAQRGAGSGMPAVEGREASAGICRPALDEPEMRGER